METNENFIEEALIHKLQIETEPIETPRPLRVLVGYLLANINQCTKLITLLVSGNHQEKIQFFSYNAIVLGLLRLSLHNPLIDWSKASIYSWIVFCHSHCLCSAQLPGCSSPDPPPGPSDLYNVPAEYRDLAEVFSRENSVLSSTSFIQFCDRSHSWSRSSI